MSVVMVPLSTQNPIIDVCISGISRENVFENDLGLPDAWS
jgi:hypothetical protein